MIKTNQDGIMEILRKRIGERWPKRVDAAHATGVSPAQMSDFMNRRMGLGMKHILSACRALGTTLEELEREAEAALAEEPHGGTVRFSERSRGYYEPNREGQEAIRIRDVAAAAPAGLARIVVKGRIREGGKVDLAEEFVGEEEIEIALASMGLERGARIWGLGVSTRELMPWYLPGDVVVCEESTVWRAVESGSQVLVSIDDCGLTNDDLRISSIAGGQSAEGREQEEAGNPKSSIVNRPCRLVRYERNEAGSWFCSLSSGVLPVPTRVDTRKIKLIAVVRGMVRKT